MLIDTYSAGKLFRLRQSLKPDEKIVVFNGSILEVVKKTKWEMWRDKWLRKK